MADVILVCPEQSTYNIYPTSGDPINVYSYWRTCFDSDPTTSAWVTYTPSEMSDYLGLITSSFDSTADIANVLQSISSFEPAVVSQFVGYYLAIFITGFAVGSVVRYMKRA